MRWRRRLLRRQRRSNAKRGLLMYRAFKILRAAYAVPLAELLYYDKLCRQATIGTRRIEQ